MELNCAFLEGDIPTDLVLRMVREINKTLGGIKAITVSKQGDLFFVDKRFMKLGLTWLCEKDELLEFIVKYRINWCAVYDEDKREFVRL